MKRPRLFGTDGVRGTFGKAPLDEPTLRRLGAALAAHLTSSASLRAPRLRVALGGDTRFSTPLICRWLMDSLGAAGAEVLFLGTVPTPCVAFAVRSFGACCGIAVSASHNPYLDNGVKLIDEEGYKWSPQAESELEERWLAMPEVAPPSVSVEPEIDRQAVAAYLDSLRGSVSGKEPFIRLSLALDAANGAASSFARKLFESLGAQVEIAHDEPDGQNINRDCGSTSPQVIAELTRSTGSDLGFAFDGDADRALLVDESGTIRDGDAMLYLWARHLAKSDQLPGRRLVATSMSNLGLELALRREEIEVARCGVGDREVVSAMRAQNILLGGEQSGHLVHLGLGTTGDGLLTALQITALCAVAARPLSQLLEGFTLFPQLIRNVRVRHKPDLETLPRVIAARAAVVEQLADSGRLVLRYSGTEPLIRIMIEGRSQTEIEGLADRLAAVLAEELS